MLPWHCCRTRLLDALVGHSLLTWHSCASHITHTDTSSANAKRLRRHGAFTQTPPLQTPCVKTAAPKITHTDTASAKAMKTAVTSPLDALLRPGPDALAREESGRAKGWAITQTVANVWQHPATFGEHCLIPQNPKVKQEPSLRVRDPEPRIHPN